MVRGARAIIGNVIDARPRSKSLPGDVVIGRDVDGIHHVIFAGNNAVGSRTVFAGDTVHVGRATTIGVNCYLHGPLTLGKYCQLGPSVAIYGTDHGLSFATAYVNSRLYEGRLKAHARTQSVTVGDDVWIGHGAVLLRGISVGSGAIIGAGAVVTRDVPEYAIVAGNPARVVRKRFSEEIIAMLRTLAWWNLSDSELASIESLFHIDLVTEESNAKNVLRDFIAALRVRGEGQ